MANFNLAYPILEKNEGGYVNDPQDLGGETYKGVARKIHPTWKGWTIIDAYKDQNGSIGTNQKLSDPLLEQYVKEFYYAMWMRIRGNEINSQAVANIVFDFYILAASAVRAVQETLNSMGANIAEDNAFGSQTLQALNSVNAASFIVRFIAKRIAYHKERVLKGLVDSKFLEGWETRAKSFATGVGNAQILVGLVLIGGVAWGLLSGNGKQQQTKTAA